MSRVESLIKFLCMRVKNLGFRVIFARIMTFYMQSGLIGFKSFTKIASFRPTKKILCEQGEKILENN